MALRVWRAEDADEWTYRGEGAANVVLGYGGSSPGFVCSAVPPPLSFPPPTRSPPPFRSNGFGAAPMKVGKVLRLQKAPRTKGLAERAAEEAPVLSAHERQLWEDVDELAASTSKEVAGQLFALHVMSPLLGPQHVDPGAHVLVSEEFLQSVERNILGQRPNWRVDAAMVNTSCDSALLMSDHSFFPHGGLNENTCIAVEIKPKCGFLPSSKFIRRENVVKTSVTRFKMHQILKLHEGQISRISEYDPLDLFSGSRERIKQAIMGLFQCPQNNFRVFFNGSLAFGALGGGMDKSEIASDETCKQINELEDLLKSVIPAENGQCLMSFLELVGEAIFSSGIMARLLEVQKLDLLDIEGAIHAYYNIISQPCLVCKNMNDVELLDRCSSLHSLTLEESLKIVRAYLIAATAKDCSLMICFRPRDGNVASDHGSVFLKATSQAFDYKACFIDLDMKPLRKMDYYYELDQKIVEFYNNREGVGMDGSSSASFSSKS